MPVTEKLNQEQGLRHQLSAGQMAMVAVGGSIGTGLLLGSAAALEIAGPGVILSFALAAFINWTVAMALGELASVHPAAGSFGLYGDLYLNEWAGFIASWILGGDCCLDWRRISSLRNLHGVLVSFRARIVLGSGFLHRASAGESSQCRKLWTVRILVRHDQSGDHRSLHHNWSRIAVERPCAAAIHLARR